MDVQDRVRAVIEPLLTPLGIELFDVEFIGGGAGSGRSQVLRVSVDRDGGVDLDTIAEVSRVVSPALDALFETDTAVRGRYTLEVSSPGVERPLRTPAHFRRVVGEMVSIKTHEEIDGERRHRGVLQRVDDDGIVLEAGGAERRLDFGQIAAARTVFEWGPAPKPGKQPHPRAQAKV
ncbi:MAG: ribosome maturation factor RimP [Actinobacteria bacterium]|nr:ribosome maturation factor RimP [Actinomycetota bacterium]